MTKKYAPDRPDAKWHRRNDTAYLRDLLAAAGLSQRAAGPLIGMSERAMRYKVSGEQELDYAEQYCLEVLADHGPGGGAEVESLERSRERVGTVWYDASERKLSAADVGKIVLGRDRFGANIVGTLVRDGFGMIIRELHNQPADVHSVPVERVVLYTLVDPPSA